jgi:hypothetical protein
MFFENLIFALILIKFDQYPANHFKEINGTATASVVII